MAPLVSVIIPAHNEELYLPDTLRSLENQTAPPFEVIVVANGCSDDTAAAARSFRARVFELEKGLCRARNLGAQKARGALLVFLDADTRLAPDGLEKIQAQFASEFAAGTLRGQPSARRLGFRALYAFKNFMHGARLYPGSSGVIVCWKDVWKKIGGFDPRLEVKENSDFIRRALRLGKYKFIGDARAVTSMRRYEKRGWARMSWVWIKIGARALVRRLRHHRYEVVR